MGGWWAADAWSSSPAFLVSWVFWVIVSIVLHELGHGFAAIRAGDRTPIELGHMTPNPIVHMGTSSLVAFALFGFAWGAMPVNPSRFRGPHDRFMVSGAGPAVNVGLAVLCGLACGLWIAIAGGYVFGGLEVADNLRENLWVFLSLGCALNVALAILNLLPIPPLDGSTMLAQLSPAYRRFYESPGAGGLGMIAFLMVFFFGGPYLLDAGFWVRDALVDAVMRVLAPSAG
ncbi:MAG: site-2 protease family protein [Phycisphaerales bacterium]|nr:site-2 protease family protein [Phycisphaerales bacterium]